jgi:hypothetical protein
MARPELSDLRAFDAHPSSSFQIGSLYTRRAPYPSFQILSHKLLTASSTSLLGSAYYDRFTPAMLSKVGMPRELSAEVKEH